PAPHRPILIPYTTLFRSGVDGRLMKSEARAAAAAERVSGLERQLAEERLQGEELRKLLDTSYKEASSAHARHEDEMEALRSLKADRKSTRLNSSHVKISY